jgi:hypothetical protein
MRIIALRTREIIAVRKQSVTALTRNFEIDFKGVRKHWSPSYNTVKSILSS